MKVSGPWFTALALGYYGLCYVISAGPQKIDPKLVPYVMEFQRLCSIYGKGEKCQRGVSAIPEIVFKDGLESKTWAGVCRVSWLGRTKWPEYIHIKRSTWEEYTELTRKALVFHELIHCVNLDHYHDKWGAGTIMEPALHFPFYYEGEWERLIEDAFTRLL